MLFHLLCLLGSSTLVAAQGWQEGGGFRLQSLTTIPNGETAAASPGSGFAEISARAAGIDFFNRLSPAQIVANNNFMNGSGVAAGDFDGDGHCDLFFCSIYGTNALFRNLGNWRFARVSGDLAPALPNAHSTGAVFADLDGDGGLDLLVATLGTGVRLFMNDGRGRFTEITQTAGVAERTGSTSLNLADVDGDGDLDLYVCNYGEIPIMRSGGSAQVQRVNNEWVVKGPYARRLKYVNGQLEEWGEPDALFLNDGSGKFARVPWGSEFFLDENGQPVAEPLDFGLSAQFRDVNGDGAPDLYVCNDFQSVDRLWLNDGRGRFRLAPALALRKEAYSSMGVDFADLDRDGRPDFMVVEMLAHDHALRLRQIMAGPPSFPTPGVFADRPAVSRNMLYRNRGDGTFAETANFSGVAATDWSWQPVFLDVDLDGYEDLLVVNGMPFDILDRDTLDRFQTFGRQTPEQSRTNLLLFPPLPTPNRAYRNLRDFRFADTSAEWRFHAREVSNGIALADLDNDGDLDVVINCLNAPPLLYRNISTAPRLKVRLRGRPPNTAGIGAVIQVSGGTLPVQSQEIIAGGKYLSGDEAVRVFAAPGSAAMTVEVHWRSGHKSVVRDVPANSEIEVFEAAAAARSFNGPDPSASSGRPVLFRDAGRFLSHVHQEIAFNDYQRQPLLPRQFSQLGPGVGWLDFDGDGHDELWVGAARGARVAIFKRDTEGVFQPLKIEPDQALPDDLAGLAAWVDTRGRPRMLAALAQYESPQPERPSFLVFQHSDTHPDIAVRATAQSSLGASSPGPIAVADFDGDADLDVFVGGRIIPGSYPAPADSVLFRNDHGVLAPVRDEAMLFKDLGLVSGAVWSEMTGDAFPELILACEWGPVKIFRNARGRLLPWSSPVHLPRRSESEPPVIVPLDQLAGWWNSVTTGDFDGDGRLDIVAGNWGRNDAYQASRARPLTLYYGNLAQRGVTDLIESCYVPGLGEEAPLRTLGALGQAFPALVAAYPSHRAFSETTTARLLSSLPVKPSRLQVNCLESMLFLNRGTYWEARPLPDEAQLAPVFGLNVADSNGDGHEDLFISQNFFAVRPEWPRLDAGRGLWLLGDGRGNLTPLSGVESGVVMYGEQRGSAVGDFNRDGRPDLVVAQNGAATRLFENVTGKPGLRVRVNGGPANPSGIGARLRLRHAGGAGPVREVHAGSGYWSQDSLVQVLGYSEYPEALEVLWPDGRAERFPVPANSLEVELTTGGGNQPQ